MTGSGGVDDRRPVHRDRRRPVDAGGAAQRRHRPRRAPVPACASALRGASGTPRHLDQTRQSCHDVFHWYGSVVNINPALVNFVVAAYERLKDRGVSLTGEAVEEFEASYRHEDENGLPHIVDGRLATLAGNLDELLADVMDTNGHSQPE